MEKKFVLTKDGSHTIFVPELNETYHSTHGAIQESHHVFIQNGLVFTFTGGKKNIRIFELGFGTGLNALLTLIQARNNQISVDYQSIEAFPLELPEIAQLNYTDQLGAAFTEDWQAIHHASWHTWSKILPNFRLRKIHAKIQDVTLDGAFDLCYFDAFAPSKQPEIWEITILEKVGNALVNGGVLVTYCSRGQLKRDLKTLGFDVETLPGPPGKKEMVRATKI